MKIFLINDTNEYDQELLINKYKGDEEDIYNIIMNYEYLKDKKEYNSKIKSLKNKIFYNLVDFENNKYIIDIRTNNDYYKRENYRKMDDWLLFNESFNKHPCLSFFIRMLYYQINYIEEWYNIFKYYFKYKIVQEIFINHPNKFSFDEYVVYNEFNSRIEKIEYLINWYKEIKDKDFNKYDKPPSFR
jgi:hypothetical protein